MPKIRKITPRIAGQLTEVWIYYSTKKGFYQKGMPSEVLSMTGKYLSNYTTEQELISDINAVIWQYNEIIKKKRKVIAYSVGLTRNIRQKKIGPGHWSGYRHWLPETMRFGKGSIDLGDHGYGFSIAWGVYIEISGDKTEYFAMNDDGSAGRKEYLDGVQIMEWTAHREQSLKNCDASIEKLVRKITELIGHQGKFIEMIDSGKKLLE